MFHLPSYIVALLLFFLSQTLSLNSRDILQSDNETKSETGLMIISDLGVCTEHVLI